jgi:general secretion pathway protein G
MKRPHHLIAPLFRTASGGAPSASTHRACQETFGLPQATRHGLRAADSSGDDGDMPRPRRNRCPNRSGMQQPAPQILSFRVAAPRATPRRAIGSAGFTLLEILVVIAILGLLIGLVAPAALRQLSGARASVVKQSIERISSVLDLYKLDVGSYPTTEQGLAALVQKPGGAGNWNGPYLKGDAIPVDPWNHPYVYRSPSERTGREFDLCSTGPNANAGSGGMICNP